MKSPIAKGLLTSQSVPAMTGSSDERSQANGTALINCSQLDGQFFVLECLTKQEKGILSGQDAWVAQPTDELTVFDPRSPREDLT